MQEYLKVQQTWLVNFYQKRNWDCFSLLIRLNFLSEELGASHAIWTIELGCNHSGENCHCKASVLQRGARLFRLVTQLFVHNQRNKIFLKNNCWALNANITALID